MNASTLVVPLTVLRMVASSFAEEASSFAGKFPLNGTAWVGTSIHSQTRGSKKKSVPRPGTPTTQPKLVKI